MSGNWLDASSTSNRYIQTYMRGFLDMSGGNLLLRNNNIIVQGGDISLNGNLTLNGNLNAKGNVLFDGSSSTNILGSMIVGTNVNMPTGIINQSTISMSGGYVYVPTDATELLYLSQFVNYDAAPSYSSVGSGTLVLGNVNVGNTTTTVMLGDMQAYGNAYFSGNGKFNAPNMGNVNFGTATLGAGATTLSSVYISGDASVNGNLLIHGNITVQQGSITNANIINTTVSTYQLIISEDISLNGRLIASSDVSLAGRLYVSGATSFNSDISVNSISVGLGGGGSITNTIVGYQALQQNTSGANNAAYGWLSLQRNTTGNSNSAFGYASIYTNTTGSNNSGFGDQSLKVNSTGSNNSAFGRQSMIRNTTGSNNSTVGAYSLYSNTTGNNNNAFGNQALTTNVNGNNNNAFGNVALYSCSGSFNAGFGDSVMYSASGNYNTAVGYSAFSTGTYSNSTAIGYNSQPTANNQIMVGTSAETMVVPGDSSFNGNLTIGKKLIVNNDISLNGNLVVYGNLTVQQVRNANIINTTVNSYQLIVSEDLSLNGELLVQGDASFGGNLIINQTGTATTGFVGIGKTNPAYTLDVSGTIRTTGGFLVTPTATTTSYVPSYLYDNHLHLRNDNKHGLGYGNTFNTAATTPIYTGIDGPFLYGFRGGVLGCTHNGSAVTLVNCLTWLNSGNVGIGVSTPTYTLDVSGQINSRNSLTVNNTSYNQYGTASAYPTNRFNTIAAGDGVNAVANGNGSVYVAGQGLSLMGQSLYWGAATPTAPSSYASQIQIDGGRSPNAVTSHGQIRFYTANNQRVVIDEDGDLGIGTTSPLYNLTVSNPTTDTFPRIAIQDTTNARYACGIGFAGARRMNFYCGEATDNLSQLTDSFIRMTIHGLTGNVGIGTTTPAYTLDVTGNIRVTTGLALTGAGGLTVTSSGTSTINSITALTGTNGLVGINQTVPTNTLDVTGNIRATTGLSVTGSTNTTTLYTTSDASINGNLLVRGNITVQQGSITNANIINTTVSTYQLIISEDISLNGRLNVQYDASLNSRLSVASDTSLNGRLFVQQDASFSGGLTVLGKLYAPNLVAAISLTNPTITGDASMNGRMYVASDSSLNGNLYVKGNIGIGITSPAYPLDVSGTIRTTGGLVVTPAATTTTYVPSYLNDNHIHFRADRYHGLGYGNTFNTAATTPIYTGIDGPILYGYGGGVLGTTSGSTLTNCLTWKNNGSVGIGKTNPAYPLDISGTLNISNPSTTATYNNVYGKGTPTTSYPSTISPTTTSATSSTWSNSNINWTSSISSLSATSMYAYQLFDTQISSGSTIDSATLYAGGKYAGNVVSINVVNSVSSIPFSISGEWAQIQSSIPLVMNSYSFSTGGNATNHPGIFSIVGSVDANTWYTVQDCSYVTNPGTALYTALSGNATISTTTTTTATIGGATLNITNQSSYSTLPYTYFRIICKSTWGGNAFELSEWRINFNLPTPVSGPSNAILIMDASNINQLDISGSLGLINSNASSITVTPCIANPGTNSWSNNNIFWTSSASSIQNTTSGYSAQAFLKPSIYIGNTGAYNGWITGVSYGSSSGLYSPVTNSTVTQNNGTINGEWLQIQCSVPVYFNGYSLGTQPSFQADLPRSYSIAASNNGTTWYDIHDATFSAWPGNLSAGATYAAVSQTTSFYSVYNATSTTVNNNAITPYTTLQTSAYTYFRLIVKSTIGTSNFGTSGGNGVLRCFWSPIFTPQTSSVSLALDNGAPNQLNVGGAMSIAGFVGIGTTNPICPLHVTTTAIVGMAVGYGTLMNTSPFYGYNTGTLPSVSIYCSGDVVGTAMRAYSDKRIKTNMHDMDNNESLIKLRNIKTKAFNYIDIISHSNQLHYGFIAQEVESVIPQAISKHKDFIPNIYDLADVLDRFTISLKTKSTFSFVPDASGTILIKLYDASNNPIETKIKNIIDDKTFEIADNINDTQIFVYGQQINDLHTVDKDQIFTVTTAAVQAIDKIVQTQQETISSLKTKNIELENRLSAIEARLLAAGI